MDTFDTESPMRQAARTAACGYRPLFRGQPLDPETECPEASLKNLRVLLKAKLEIVAIHAVEHGHVFFVFSSGDTYLATGFAVGVENRKVEAFAQLLLEACGGNKKAWAYHLCDGYVTHDRKQYEGPIDFTIDPTVDHIIDPGEITLRISHPDS